MSTGKRISLSEARAIANEFITQLSPHAFAVPKKVYTEADVFDLANLKWVAPERMDI